MLAGSSNLVTLAAGCAGQTVMTTVKATGRIIRGAVVGTLGCPRALAAATVMVGSIIVYRSRGSIREAIGPYITTRVISMVMRRPEQADLRSAFRSLAIDELPVNENNHSHGFAAANRTAANNAIDDFVEAAGYGIYSVSKSARDVRAGQRGCRLYHTAKDLAMDADYSEPLTSDVIKMIDVDYYRGVLRQYAALGQPLILYTFAPKRVAGKVPDGQFFSVKGFAGIMPDEVVTTYGGGARYHHALWDYDHECVVFDYWWGQQVYLVERIEMPADPDRSIIGLFPIATVRLPFGLSFFLPGDRVVRRQLIYGDLAANRFSSVWITKQKKIVDGKVTEIDKIERDVRCVSLALPGSHDSVTLPERVVIAALLRVGQKKEAIGTSADFERILSASGADDPLLLSPLLAHVQKMAHVYLGLPVRTDGGRAAASPRRNPNYQAAGPLAYEDGEPYTRVVGPAYCEGNVGPVSSFNNDMCCVTNRIVKPRNDIRSKDVPLDYHRWRREFCEYLVPADMLHVGMPFSLEEVEALQNRPSQVASWRDAKTTSRMHSNLVLAFQKKETYGKLAFPRNISPLNADHRTRYGAFMYSITEVLLKTKPWYAFAKTPVEIADAVMRVAQASSYLVPTDYSNWDGTHSEFLMELEGMLGRRFFHTCTHREWTSLQRGQYKANGITKHGVRYDTWFSRLSGSSDTSAFNTLNNAFLAFCALRGLGCDVETSVARLGIYGGDDGLTGNVPVERYQKVAKDLGHVITTEVVRAGEVVPFLGRRYIDPWNNNYSTIDVKRQVMRLHLSVAPKNVPDELALFRKAQGYMVTDPNTPFISEWARLVMRSYPGYSNPHQRDKDCPREYSWFAQYDSEVQFPQEPWRVFTDTAVAAQLGVEAGELRAMCERLNQHKHIRESDYEDYLFDFPTPVKIVADWDGELHYPDPAPNGDPESVTTVTTSSTQPGRGSRGRRTVRAVRRTQYERRTRGATATDVQRNGGRDRSSARPSGRSGAACASPSLARGNSQTSAIRRADDRHDQTSARNPQRFARDPRAAGPG